MAQDMKERAREAGMGTRVTSDRKSAKELKAAVAKDHAEEARRLVAELEAARLRSAAANLHKALGAKPAVAKARDEARAEYKRIKAELNQLRLVAPGAVARAQDEAARAAERKARE